MGLLGEKLLFITNLDVLTIYSSLCAIRYPNPVTSQIPRKEKRSNNPNDIQSDQA